MIPIVETHYKIKHHYGAVKEPVEIQQIVEKELGGESLQWTIGKGAPASEPSVRLFIILVGNDLLICKAFRVLNVYSSTLVSQQLWPKLPSQKVAYVLVYWRDTAANSTRSHYH